MMGNAEPPGLSAPQHYEAAKAFHRQGRFAEAEFHYRVVLQAEPDHGDAMEWMGALCAQTGRLEEAIAWLSKAIARNAGCARLHGNLATALGMAQRYDEAAVTYRQSLELDPGAAQTWCDLGLMLSRLARAEDAVAAFERALALRPDLVPARENLGYALSSVGRQDAALRCFERVLAARPGVADAQLNYGVALAACGRHEEAVAQFRKVVAARPHDARALHNLASSLSALDDPDGALEVFERARVNGPDLPEVACGMGNALLQLGRLEDARPHFERAVALAPQVGAFQRALAEAKHFRAGDPQIKALEDLLRNEASTTAKERIELHFALAKAYDDLQCPAIAFDHWKKANTLKRAAASYDEAADLAALTAIGTAFSTGVIGAKSGLGDASDVPVFIVGMPRSGTTLVEQILASHPAVFGGGERPAFGRATGCGYGAEPLPLDPAALSGADLRGMAMRYLERLVQRAPSAKRITDKLPANFRLIGLVHLVLPKARIIHVRRDPVDTCFSLYTKLFLDDIGFAYDLGELGRYYRGYERLMAHWRAVLPAGAIVDVEYEALVADFDGEARRIIAACGLDWDERCATFYDNGRSVRTSSAIQVRQPIYRTSVGRWRAYEEFLGPLIDALGGEDRSTPS